MSNKTKVANTSWNVMWATVLLCVSLGTSALICVSIWYHPSISRWTAAWCAYCCGASNIFTLSRLNDTLGAHLKALEGL